MGARRRSRLTSMDAVRHGTTAALFAAFLGMGVSRASAASWPDVPERIERDLGAADVPTRRSAAQRMAAVSGERGARLARQALADSDIEVRLAGAQMAIRVRAAGVTSLVLPWLGDRDPRLRLAACEVAKVLPDPAAIPPLGRALGDADAAVRAAAATALGAHGRGEARPDGRADGTRDPIPPLLGKLDDASPVVRVQIARALARLGDPRAVVPLVGKVQDSVPEVRQAVARALGELGDGRAAQALLLQLRDPSPEVQVEAMTALGRLRSDAAVESLASLAASRVTTVRQGALATLGHIGTPNAVKALVAALGTAEDATAENEASPVREALLAAGPVAIGELRAALLGVPSRAVAMGAAWTLGELHARDEAPVIIGAVRRGVLPAAAGLRALTGAGSPDAVSFVLEYLRDPSAQVRSEAQQAAAALLDPAHPDGRAVEPIAALLASGRLPTREQAALVFLLGRTGAPRAATLAAGFVGSKDRAVRLAALDALANLGPAGADDALLTALADPDGTVRVHAAATLAEAGGAKSATALLARLDEGGEMDRAAALAALGGILSRVGENTHGERLTRHLPLAAGGERDALLLALTQARGSVALGVVDTIARGDDPHGRTIVAGALGARGGNDTTRALARRLLADADGAVRAQAAWTLGTVGDASDVPLLTARREGGTSDEAVNAAGALARLVARLGHGPVGTAQVAPLCGLLSDPRPYVRTNALAGLAKVRGRCADGAPERNILESDESDAVRGAAAAALGARATSAPSDPDRRALERCAGSDRAAAVARRCGGAPPPRAVPTATRSVSVYVIPEGAAAPTPGAPYALRFGDLVVRTGSVDGRGQVFEAAAPAGDLTLLRPLP